MYGGPLSSATFRGSPEDFQVDEILDIPISGIGEHLWLLIVKREQNTTWVAGLLAKLAGIRRQDVGFCGLKDRYAVTRQWFSLYLPGREIDLASLAHDDFKIIEGKRHQTKLRRGMHSGNQFCIQLREFKVSTPHLSERINVISEKGVPNYFGEQRFGRNGNNLVEVQNLVDIDKLKGNRKGTGLYLSAARSWLFNLTLAECINKQLITNFEFHQEIGALWGRGRSCSSLQIAELEERVLNDWRDWCYALEHSGLGQQSRSLTVRPNNLTFKEIDKGNWLLEFSLPKGSYATVMLREIAQLSRSIEHRL